MKPLKLLSIKVFVLLFLASASKNILAQRFAYPDILNLKTSVADPKDIHASVFSDMGAWFAYALPANEKDYGGFAGPLIMDMDGKWLSSNFSQLHLTLDGEGLDFSKAKVTSNYFPGILTHVIETGNLQIIMRLIFVSGRQALLNTSMRNTGKSKMKLDISYSGKSLLPNAVVKNDSGKIIVDLPKERDRFYIRFVNVKTPEIKTDSNWYIARFKSIVLSPAGTLCITQEHGYYTLSEAMPQKYFQSFGEELGKNEDRWNGYLEKYFSDVQLKTVKERELAVKSMVTLMTNWRSPFKDILHHGVFPSVNYQGFYGVWSWDSWKQAVGLSLFDPWLAQENIRCMFDYQDKYGMIADCVFADKSENNWRDTKPPLAAWAVWNVYLKSKNKKFLKELYPKLAAYHQWWYANRDHDQNGLCEYGSTDGTRIAAAWESGMDNAVRFDSAVMVKNNDHAWSLNQESVDLNSYLCAEKFFLSDIVAELGLKDAAKKWKSDAEKLIPVINHRFFDSKRGYYFDRLIDKKEFINAEGPEGWIPLWAGIATKEIASSVEKIMADEKKFNTKVPLPTLEADNPKFNPKNGYWRGPVWLDQFYFGVMGLKKYGYENLAKEMIRKLFENAEGLLENQPIHENYHPVTGEALNAANFSWSTAHILMLLKEMN